MLINDECSPRISDFGLSCTIGRPQPGLSYLQRLSSAKNVGAVRWAIPEQLSGCEPHQSANVYLFGCIMFEVMTHLYPLEKTEFYVRCCLGTFCGWKKRTISRLSL